MGMMIRRNMKQRAAKKAAPVNVVEEKKENEFAEITKTDIYRMPTADLRRLAKDNGIGNAEEMTGVELKKILVAKL